MQSNWMNVPDENTWVYREEEPDIAREKIAMSVGGTVVAYWIYSIASPGALEVFNRTGPGVLHHCGNYVWPAVDGRKPWWCLHCKTIAPESIRTIAAIMVGWGYDGH